MNIKIQGGGSGTYANTGSCTGVTTYLQHEDLERMKNGREVQPFFNNSRDYISAQEVTFKIDTNKAHNTKELIFFMTFLFIIVIYFYQASMLLHICWIS